MKVIRIWARTSPEQRLLSWPDGSITEETVFDYDTLKQRLRVRRRFLTRFKNRADRFKRKPGENS